MNKETMQLLIDELRPLAEKLGEAPEFLWEVAMRQVEVSFWLSVISIVFLIIIAYLIAMKARKEGIFERARKHEYNDLDFVFFTVVTILVIFSVIIIPFEIGNIIQILANPEWKAIEIIMTLTPNI